jgi:predicted PurR-regulated permease PerM
MTQKTHCEDDQGGTQQGSTEGDATEAGATASTDESRLFEGRITVTRFEEHRAAPVFFILLFASSFAALLYVLRDFIGDLVMAFILVGLVRGPYEWLGSRLVRNRWLASGMVTVLVAVVIVVPLAVLAFTIASEAATLYGSSEPLLEHAGTLLDRGLSELHELGVSISKDTLLGRLDGLVRSGERVAVAAGGAVVSNVFGMALHLATVLVMVFYIRVDGDRLRRFLYALSPLPDDEDALLEETFRRVARGVVLGQGLGSTIQGCLGGLSFWLVGIPSPILWASVMVIAAFLPLVGVTAIAIPAGIWLLATGHPAAAIGVIVFNVVQGAVIDNVVKTKLMGSAMRMHDLLVFLSMLGGITAFGLIGIVYGPLIAMLFMTLTDLYLRVYRRRLAERFADAAR